MPQNVPPRDDSGFGPLRDGESDYDGRYDRDRQPPENLPPAGQPDGFAPKQPTFGEPGGNSTFDDGTYDGTYGGFGGNTDTRLRLPSFGPWRPDSDANTDDEPTPRDLPDGQRTDTIRGRRPAPALNLDDKIARHPAPQRTRLTARESSSPWLPVAHIERHPEPTTTNTGWLPNNAATQVVSK